MESWEAYRQLGLLKKWGTTERIIKTYITNLNALLEIDDVRRKMSDVSYRYLTGKIEKVLSIQKKIHELEEMKKRSRIGEEKEWEIHELEEMKKRSRIWEEKEWEILVILNGIKERIIDVFLVAAFLLPEEYADQYIRLFLDYRDHIRKCDISLEGIYTRLTGYRMSFRYSLSKGLAYNPIRIMKIVESSPSSSSYRELSRSCLNFCENGPIPQSKPQIIKRLHQFYQKYRNRFNNFEINDPIDKELIKILPQEEEIQRKKEEDAKKEIRFEQNFKNYSDRLKRELQTAGFQDKVPYIEKEFMLFSIGLYLLPPNQYSKYYPLYLAFSEVSSREALFHYINIIPEHYLNYKMFFKKIDEDHSQELNYNWAIYKDLEAIIKYINKVSKENPETTRRALRAREEQIIKLFNEMPVDPEMLGKIMRETPESFWEVFELAPGQPKAEALKLYNTLCGKFKKENISPERIKEFLVSIQDFIVREKGYKMENLTDKDICSILNEYSRRPAIRYYFY